jgi:hypothetical protein
VPSYFFEDIVGKERNSAPDVWEATVRWSELDSPVDNAQ